MNSKISKLSSLILFTLFVCKTPATLGNCTDFPIPGEYPPEIITKKGTKLTFSYQFGNDETYSYSWVKGQINGGPIGPNYLQPSCKIPEIAHESSEFLLLEKGCGTFCWYYVVLGLYPTGNSTTGTYETIDRPLAFDDERSLVANYRLNDFIGIKNLKTGYEQIFKTGNSCESASGLCFSSVKFTQDSLIYKWDSPTSTGQDEILSQKLDEGLFSNE